MASNIVKQLKNLRDVAPSAEWKENNRRILMSEIKKGAIAAHGRESWASEISGAIFPWKVFKLVARPMVALTAVAGLVLGGGLSVSASQVALPGDTLYPLKIAAEKVQVALTFDKKQEAKMHVELADRRISELKKIREGADSPQNKIQKINVAVDKFQQEIAVVKTKLDTMNDKLSPQTTVEVAKIVDSKVDEYKDTLAKVTADIPTAGVTAQKISQGLNMTDETGDRALAVIVENHVQGEVVQPEEDVVKRVEQKIETAAAKVAAVEGQINTLPAIKVGQAQQTTVVAKEALAQARAALDQKDVAIALNKTIESRELAKQAEQMAADAVSTNQTVATGCGDNQNCNSGTNSDENPSSVANTDLTNAPINGTNTNTNTNTNTSGSPVASPVKTYVRPAKPVVSVPPPEPVIDETTLKVGIDLKQSPPAE